MESTRKTVRGELALVVIVFINSFGVVLMLHSGSGISAISSVPYAFSEVLPRLSLGTWTYLFQACLVATLLLWVSKLPNTLPLDILYFVISYLVICFGIALSNRCQMPIIPTDLFPRELADITGLPYSKIKIPFDVICLVVTAVLTGARCWRPLRWAR